MKEILNKSFRKYNVKWSVYQQWDIAVLMQRLFSID